jgi:hypothetical protein
LELAPQAHRSSVKSIRIKILCRQIKMQFWKGKNGIPRSLGPSFRDVNEYLIEWKKESAYNEAA